MEPFVTKDGREIPLRAVGLRYVQMIMDRTAIPDVPTYTAETVAGDVEVHKHVVKRDRDGKLVGTTLQSDEDWAEWNAYEQARSDALAKRMQDAITFLMCECVQVDPPDEWAWSVDFEGWGMEPPEIPEDPRQRKLFWIENELLPDSDDLTALTARLYVIGGIVGEDQAKNLESFFRLAVARLSAG